MKVRHHRKIQTTKRKNRNQEMNSLNPGDMLHLTFLQPNGMVSVDIPILEAVEDPEFGRCYVIGQIDNTQNNKATTVAAPHFWKWDPREQNFVSCGGTDGFPHGVRISIRYGAAATLAYMYKGQQNAAVH